MQENERPLLRSNVQLLSLKEIDDGMDDYLDDAAESSLRMDDYMYMRMQHEVEDSPECTASCVASCGRLAELPRTEASQLVGCFEETCGCRNKWSSSSRQAPTEMTRDYQGLYDIDDDETDLMKQYFDLIHNQERVEYLMLQ